MAEKDVTEKLLEDYNDVFSDIVNVLLFGGEEVVKEDELEATGAVSQYKAAKKIHGQERDVPKYWKGRNGTINIEIRLAFFGVENQTDVDSDMPFRVVGYDGAEYRNQMNDDKGRYPVITLVLYFGTDMRWKDEYKSLYGVLDIPEKMKPYVSDYKINVFEIAWLDDETVKKFKSDFHIVADYFVQARKNKNYIPSEERIKHVSEVLDLMSVMTGDSRFEDAQNNSKKGKVTNMSSVITSMLDEVENRGVERGMEQGKEQGKAEMILGMYRKNYTLEQISDVAKKSVADVQAIIANAQQSATA